MRKKHFHPGIALLLFCLVSLPLAQNTPGDPPAYREIDVTNGGRIRGVVKGPPLDEPLKDHHVTKDLDACGKKIINEAYLVSDEGFIQNSVVSIENISRGKPIDKNRRPRLDNRQCRFQPHVLAVAAGQKIEIVNGDPILHNTHAKMDGKRTVFNVALPIQNQKIPKTIRKTGSMTLRCDAGHLWMSGYVIAFAHPYFSVTGKEGAFEIDGIPPGKYVLNAWHEKLGEQKLSVEIETGKTVEIVFDDLSSSVN